MFWHTGMKNTVLCPASIFFLTLRLPATSPCGDQKGQDAWLSFTCCSLCQDYNNPRTPNTLSCLVVCAVPCWHALLPGTVNNPVVDLSRRGSIWLKFRLPTRTTARGFVAGFRKQGAWLTSLWRARIQLKTNNEPYEDDTSCGHGNFDPTSSNISNAVSLDSTEIGD